MSPPTPLPGNFTSQRTWIVSTFWQRWMVMHIFGTMHKEPTSFIWDKHSPDIVFCLSSYLFPSPGLGADWLIRISVIWRVGMLQAWSWIMPGYLLPLIAFTAHLCVGLDMSSRPGLHLGRCKQVGGRLQGSWDASVFSSPLSTFVPNISLSLWHLSLLLLYILMGPKAFQY